MPKKILTLKSLAIIAVIIIILTAIAAPQRVQDFRNKAAQELLISIALAEVAMQPEPITPSPPTPTYAYTDGEDETAEAAVMKLVESSFYYCRNSASKYNFSPDGSIAFQIMRPGAINGKVPPGFVAFAAHNSVGSTVYVYDNISDLGVVKARAYVEYGGVLVTRSVPVLYCYNYDPLSKSVKKNPHAIKLAPDPEDEYQPGLLVGVAAD